MKTAIIIHGMPSKKDYFNRKWDTQTCCHWLPWIQKQLIINNILAQAIEMPEPYLPKYNEWKKELERFDLNENTMLIWHSWWAGFIIRRLSENKIKVGKVALVAPRINAQWVDSYNFFDFKIDEDLVKKTESTRVFVSRDDSETIKDFNKLKKEIKNLDILEFENKWHFCFKDLKTRAFPELLEYLIN